jgi:NAD(P)H dehydrogenase (quinone)
MLAVTGSTGQLGRLIIRSLGAMALRPDVIALARTPSRAADLGVTVREADYDRADTLERALSDVDRLLFVSSSEVGKRAAHHGGVIAAAKQNGVKWIGYTSVLHADTSPLDLAAEHRWTERALKESGIPHTILRNGWYTENYTGAIPGALAGGALLGSAGSGRISSATRADYADAAVAVLTSNGHEGRTYELAGDEAWTLTDLAAEVSRQVGRTIPYEDLPEAEYAAILKGAGLPENLAHAIAGWDVAVSQDALFDDGHQLSTLIGRPTTPLSVAVSKALQAG